MKDLPLRNAEQLGAAVRVKRKVLGLSQSALAEQLGVERKWVLRLEAGNPKAELALVLKALEALQMKTVLRDAGSEQDRAPARASRLDELFERLQRREK